ncbi:MAG: transporter, partial [Clostridia bacterium]|nr:transporter [Clostridia bacterium]
MQKKKSGAKTLLWSIIMSSPGPLVVGLGLIAGRSSTQIADFVRRSAELLAIVMSFAVYTSTQRNDVCDEEKKRRAERRSNVFVGSMMCLAGAIMAVLAFAVGSEEKGNVIPGLVIAVLGVI